MPRFIGLPTPVPTLLLLLVAGSCTHAAAGRPSPARSTAGRAETPEAKADSVVRLVHSMTGGPDTLVRELVRDSARWREVLARWTRPAYPGAAPPAVDFTSHMVVVAAMGGFPSTGYDVFVDSVRRTRSEVLVYVRSDSSVGCVAGAIETQPIDVVRVPRSPLPARFVESSRVERCE
jgi:hypothetical protein